MPHYHNLLGLILRSPVVYIRSQEIVSNCRHYFLILIVIIIVIIMTSLYIYNVQQKTKDRANTVLKLTTCLD